MNGPALASPSAFIYNLKLVRTSQYLPQSRLEVHYRLGRIHQVPNTLSRLVSEHTDAPTHETLYPFGYEKPEPEAVAFYDTLVGMPDSMKTDIRATIHPFDAARHGYRIPGHVSRKFSI
jgi:hypothetical protein